eukprot:TRINITY_DN5648_c0_g1_i2.p1 TRINITY_DN5648_c0_g1~~TRINITY_DN5648_c0_g1_i2.p1  ORF type:complete len:197 (+),score=36.93 TRINITY_DN5648_c0_g1_i2:130-720(+)
MDYGGNTSGGSSFLNPSEADVKAVMESCGMRAAMSFVGGGVLGAGMGVFFASMDVSMPYSMPGMPVPAGQPTWEQRQKMTIRETFRDMGRQVGSRAWSYGKSFAFIGLIFAGTECQVESYRARHDSVNTAAAACFTGGIMGLRGGPGPAMFGCGTFVAFSLAMDALMAGSEFGGGGPPPKAEEEAKPAATAPAPEA